MADPTDADRVKAKAALGELGEVTTAVEAVARLVDEERRRVLGMVGSFAAGLEGARDAGPAGIRRLRSFVERLEEAAANGG